MNLQRLDKIIATQLNISRTDAKADIRRGNVSVDGEIIRDPSRSFCGESCTVLYKGQAVNIKEHIYIALNKPKGVLSASNDKKRKTVVDLVPRNLYRMGMAPVGRLDKDTTGLLLITDDGQFAHRVISPKNGISKLYEVLLDGEIPQSAIGDFEKGIILADGTRCLSANLQILEKNKARVEIMEGKYHQIKRMFGVVGLGVTELKRLRIGEYALPLDLAEGECIELTSQDLERVLK